MSATVFHYHEPRDLPHHAYLLPALLGIFSRHPSLEKRAFEIGCGDGYIADKLSQHGFDVIGVDPSPSGISVAKTHFPTQKFFIGSSENDLSRVYGVFPFVYSIETIAHVANPALFARRVYELLDAQGVAIVSTPFHGYWKNLAISILGGWDRHWHTLEEAQYLSLFSEITFRQVWRDAGFRNVTIIRVGRLNAFAKAMIAILQKA